MLEPQLRGSVTRPRAECIHRRSVSTKKSSPGAREGVPCDQSAGTGAQTAGPPPPPYEPIKAYSDLTGTYMRLGHSISITDRSPCCLEGPATSRKAPTPREWGPRTSRNASGTVKNLRKHPFPIFARQCLASVRPMRLDLARRGLVSVIDETLVLTRTPCSALGGPCCRPSARYVRTCRQTRLQPFCQPSVRPRSPP